MESDSLNIIGKFYLVDQTEMTDKEMVEIFFEFLKHMEEITDVIESMARKMEEMDKRVKALERKKRKTNENDEGGMFWIP